MLMAYTAQVVYIVADSLADDRAGSETPLCLPLWKRTT